jgi:hypothetical protein
MLMLMCSASREPAPALVPAPVPAPAPAPSRVLTLLAEHEARGLSFLSLIAATTMHHRRLVQDELGTFLAASRPACR